MFICIMGRKGNSGTVGALGLIVLAIIGGAITYWYVVVPVLIACLFLFYSSRQSQQKEDYKRAKQAEVLGLAQKLQKDLEYATDGKSLKTRLSNCDDALEMLSKIDSIDTEFNFVTNKAELREKVTRLKKVLPVMELIEKRSKQAFMGEPKKELKTLKEMLYHIQSAQIADADFEKLGLKDDPSGMPVSKAFIEGRLKELGGEA